MLMTPKHIARLLTVAVLAVAAPVFAQTNATPNRSGASTSSNIDGRWTPWLGCWRLSQEQVREESQSIEAALRPATSNSAAPGMIVCVQPSGATGVTMTTFADGKTLLEQTVVG